MGTAYFRLAKPFTSVRPEELGGHTHVGVWVNHAKAGELVFRNEEWKEAVHVLREECVAHDYYGGEGTGCVVEEYTDLRDDECLISENGEVLSVYEMRARRGAGK